MSKTTSPVLSDNTPGLPGLLSAQDEVDLAGRIEAGVLAQAVLDGDMGWPDGATREELEALVGLGDEAWQHFLGANVRMVRLLAWEAHRRSGVDVDELFQEGFVGLAEAVRRFDVRAGVRFSTYGFGWVRNRVLECQVRRGGALEATVYRARQARMLRERRDQLEARLGHGVGAAEVAREVGRSTGWVQAMLVADLPSTGDVAVDELPLACPAAEARFERCTAGVPTWFDDLSPLERRVLCLRYGLLDDVDRSFEACARRLGVSASTVRRVERAALVRARRILTEEPALLAA